MLSKLRENVRPDFVDISIKMVRAYPGDAASIHARIYTHAPTMGVESTQELLDEMVERGMLRKTGSNYWVDRVGRDGRLLPPPVFAEEPVVEKKILVLHAPPVSIPAPRTKSKSEEAIEDRIAMAKEIARERREALGGEKLEKKPVMTIGQRLAASLQVADDSVVSDEIEKIAEAKELAAKQEKEKEKQEAGKVRDRARAKQKREAKKGRTSDLDEATLSALAAFRDKSDTTDGIAKRTGIAPTKSVSITQLLASRGLIEKVPGETIRIHGRDRFVWRAKE